MVTTTQHGDGSVTVTPSEGQTGGAGTGSASGVTYKTGSDAMSALANENSQGSRVQGQDLPGTRQNFDLTYQGRNISQSDAQRLGLIDKPGEFGTKAVAIGVSPQEVMRQSSEKSREENIAAFGYGQTVDNLDNIPRAGSRPTPPHSQIYHEPARDVTSLPPLPIEEQYQNKYIPNPDRAVDFIFKDNEQELIFTKPLPGRTVHVDPFGDMVYREPRTAVQDTAGTFAMVSSGLQYGAESVINNVPDPLPFASDRKHFGKNFASVFTGVPAFAGEILLGAEHHYGNVVSGKKTLIGGGFEQAGDATVRMFSGVADSFGVDPVGTAGLTAGMLFTPGRAASRSAIGSELIAAGKLYAKDLVSIHGTPVYEPVLIGIRQSAARGVNAVKEFNPRIVEVSDSYALSGLGVITKKKYEIRLKNKVLEAEDSFLPHPKKNEKLEPILTAKKTTKETTLDEKWRLRDESNKDLSGSVNKEGQTLLSVQLTKQRAVSKSVLNYQNKYKDVSLSRGKTAQRSRLDAILKKRQREKTEQKIDTEFKQMTESQGSMSLGQFAFTNIAIVSARQRLAQKNAQDILGAQSQQFNVQQDSQSLQDTYRLFKQKNDEVSLLSLKSNQLSLQTNLQLNQSIQKNDNLQRNLNVQRNSNLHRTDNLLQPQASVKSRTQYSLKQTRVLDKYRPRPEKPVRPRKTKIMHFRLSENKASSDPFNKRVKTNQQQSYGIHDPLYPASLESVTLEEMSLGGGRRARHIRSRSKSQKHFSNLISSGQSIPTLSQSRHRNSKSNWRKLNL